MPELYLSCACDGDCASLDFESDRGLSPDSRLKKERIQETLDVIARSMQCNERGAREREVSLLDYVQMELCHLMAQDKNQSVELERLGRTFRQMEQAEGAEGARKQRDAQIGLTSAQGTKPERPQGTKRGRVSALEKRRARHGARSRADEPD